MERRVTYLCRDVPLCVQEMVRLAAEARKDWAAQQRRAQLELAQPARTRQTGERAVGASDPKRDSAAAAASATHMPAPEPELMAPSSSTAAAPPPLGGEENVSDIVARIVAGIPSVPAQPADVSSIVAGLIARLGTQKKFGEPEDD